MDFSQPELLPKIAAVFPGNAPAICASYHENGQRLYVASEDDARLQVIDCLEGKLCHVPLRIEREQIHLVEATHHEHTVLVAGKGSATQPTGQRNAVSYWSLYDNKIIRKFRGHTDRITHLSMSPADDTFLSSSSDGTVRLWTANQAGCVAELKLPNEAATGSPIAAFDSTGLVFCAAAAMTSNAGDHFVHLYDARNYSGGAFAEFKLLSRDVEKSMSALETTAESSNRDPLLYRSTFRSIQFNASGSSILVGTESGLKILLDGFDGFIQRVLYEGNASSPVVAGSSTSSSNKENRSAEAVACFSSDDKYVLAGDDSGRINCWDVTNGKLIKSLEGHKEPITCVASNPKYKQIASACSQIALWLF